MGSCTVAFGFLTPSCCRRGAGCPNCVSRAEFLYRNIMVSGPSVAQQHSRRSADCHAFALYSCLSIRFAESHTRSF